jgi:Zn-dependent M16 (insulinase) family peptidase
MLVHPIFTNGICYVELAFPLDVLAPEDYLWLPFFARAAVSVGLPGMDYGEVSSLMARTSGGFFAMLHSGSPAPGSLLTAAHPTGNLDLRGRDWIIFRLKALDEKIRPSLDLAKRLICEADFSDLKRLRDLALEMKNEIDSNLAPMGHVYAAGFSSRLFSRSRIVDELWSGLDQTIFAHKLAQLEASEISAKLRAIQTALAGAGLIVNFTGSAEAGKAIGKCFGSFGPPRPRSSESQGKESFLAISAFKSLGSVAGPVVFASPSLQVGFASISLSAVPYDSPLQAAELVLSHQLSTGALWEEIRMKGGAYGAFAQSEHLEGVFSFASYRDPEPLRTLEAFTRIIGEASKRNRAGNSIEDTYNLNDTLDKAVIGTYARETRPHTPAEKGITDFFRFLYGIEDEYRSRRLKGIIAVSAEQTDAALKRLADEINITSEQCGAYGKVHPVIIAGEAEARKAAARLGTEARELPV